MSVRGALRRAAGRSRFVRQSHDTTLAARAAWRAWPKPVLPADRLLPAWPNEGPEPTFPNLVSQACTDMQIRSLAYREWVDRLHMPNVQFHRKQWEWFYIAQALEEAGVIRDGASGIGFGVGTEPLGPWFASQGCRILATDHPGGEHAESWSSTGELAHSLADLNERGVCDQATFEERVRYQPIDMRDLSSIDERFDFAWSSCAFEHLGSIDAGLRFLEQHLDLLKPGGIGVHTTELNVSSTEETLDHGGTVLFRRPDLERFAARIADRADVAPLNFHLGVNPNDRYVAPAHHFSWVVLKYAFNGHVTTSFGLIVRKKPE
ncbi:MAG: hypothetical protein JWO68_372 [Actinomycetia bacterium]|nr:hypothetical protein [Actinomycetes bacterium]